MYFSLIDGVDPQSTRGKLAKIVQEVYQFSHTCKRRVLRFITKEISV